MPSKYLKKEKQKVCETLNDTQKIHSEKKLLKNVLSSYMKKPSINEKCIKKMKKELSNIKYNINNAKNSFETIMDIQKKLSQVYNNLSTNEQKKIKKNN